jgi:glycosyltransferase involved in cell wall biosynthesis
MRGYFGHASGLVLPSLEDNCPMAVLEAMAAGVPVAAAKVGGVPELIRHGETGWLFDPTDSGAIAVAMKKLLENPASEMASLARSEARTRFHPRVIAVRHLEIYREVLASRTGSNAPSIGRKALHHSRS